MFFNFLMMFPSAVQKITYPAISHYYAKRQMATIVELVNTILRFSFTFLSILSLFLLFYVDDLIALVFPGKESFMMAVTPLRVLVILGLMYSVIAPVSIIFACQGRPDIPSKISVVKAVTNIGLGVVLIPFSLIMFSFEFGLLNGVAIAIGSGFVAEVILFFLYLPKYLKKYSNKKTLLAGLSIFCIFGTGSYLALSALGLNENLVGIIIIPLYGALLYVTGILTKESIMTIIRVVTSKKMDGVKDV
jgi:O-antigen/teichoic acid export membrane protein